MSWLKRLKTSTWGRRGGLPPSRGAGAELQPLEARVVLYSASGNVWMNPTVITISFMPDGTNLGGVTSNLSASFNSKPALVGKWQSEILRAAQVWAEQTNINLALVPDNGQPSGTGLYQKGDPRYGDIRIGGYNFGNSTLARAYMPPPVNNYSIAGDVVLNTGMTYNINETYDLFTVATHEIGHSLGLRHSTVAQAQEFATYNAIKRALNGDDVAGIRASYSPGASRGADWFDADGTNETMATADSITTGLTSTLRDLDITSTADIDYYRFQVPGARAWRTAAGQP